MARQGDAIFDVGSDLVGNGGAWTRARIRYRLDEHGYSTFRAIDVAFSLPIGTISSTLSRPDPRGERIISDIIGVPAHVLWPDRYDAKGRRLKPQPDNQIRAEINARHRQNGRAA